MFVRGETFEKNSKGLYHRSILEDKDERSVQKFLLKFIEHSDISDFFEKFDIFGVLR